MTRTKHTANIVNSKGEVKNVIPDDLNEEFKDKINQIKGNLNN